MDEKNQKEKTAVKASECVRERATLLGHVGGGGGGGVARARKPSRTCVIFTPI